MTKVSSGKADSTKEDAKDYYVIQKERFEVGDCILVKGEASKTPFVSIPLRQTSELLERRVTAVEAQAENCLTG